MKTRDFNKLKGIIENFKSVKVLVIGDLILDEFLWGDVTRISPEAPVVLFVAWICFEFMVLIHAFIARVIAYDGRVSGNAVR